MFRDMAREEMSTSEHNTMFGSRKNLLADIGAENIVIPAEQAGQFAGMNIGKLTR